jgi:hypothetical protein
LACAAILLTPGLALARPANAKQWLDIVTRVEAKGDDFIRNRIKTGSPKGMPSFANQLAPTELDALIVFVKSP